MKIKEMEHYLFLTKLFDYSQLKVQTAAFYASILAMITSFSNNILGVSVLLFGLLILVMITDYITGLAASKHEEVVAAKAEGRAVKDVFKSKKGLGWIFKLGSYMIFLAISFQMQKEITLEYGFDILGWPMKLFHFYILIHIFLWETKSVDENFERLGYSFRVLKLADSLFVMAKTKIKKKLDE